MKKTFFIFAALFIMLFAPSSGQVKDEPVPPPSNMDELKKMMEITYDQNVLPQGASADTLERLLEKGQVVLMIDDPPGGIAWMAVAGILINAPVETSFGVATGFKDYPDVVPMTAKAEAVPIDTIENLYRVDFTIELLFSWLKVDYSVYHYHRPPFRTDWCHAAGEFDINSGFWQFIPTSDGKSTMAFYSVYSEPRMATVKAMYRDEPALELMTNVATATMVTRAVKDEAEKRNGKSASKRKNSDSVEKILTDDPATLGLMAEKGKILVLEDGPTVYITAVSVVDQSPEKAYETVVDFDKYTEFLPGVKQARVTGKSDKGITAYQEVTIRLWKFDFRSESERLYEIEPNSSVRWTIERENGGPVPGFWSFTPLEGGKCLMVNGTTEDLRAMGFIPKTALKMQPTLEYGLLGAMVTAGIDAFKARIEGNK